MTQMEKLQWDWDFYNNEEIPAPSTYLACYYLNIAANYRGDGFTDSDCYLYSMALARLDDDFNYGIPMFSLIPAVLFWARKSNDRGCSNARAWLKMMESFGQNFCNNCKKEAQADKKFQQCSKCRAQWYSARNVRLRRGRPVTRKTAKEREY